MRTALNGITVAPGLDAKKQALVDRLAGLSGEDFDRAWLRAQLWAHRSSLALTLRGAIRGDVPEIRTLAQGALPVITRHLGDLLDLAQAGDDGDSGWDRHGARHGDKHGHHRGRGHESRRSSGRR